VRGASCNTIPTIGPVDPGVTGPSEEPTSDNLRAGLALPFAQVLLASASPRRRLLLDQLGVRYRWRVVEVDETRRPGERPGDYVTRLALAKARAGWQAQIGMKLPVLAADTAVVRDGEVFGKPRDREHGLAVLARLAGGSHQVYSAVAVAGMRAETWQCASRLSVSTVCFRRLSDAECEAYWATGEGVDKAGGYAIQGLAAAFIDHLAGSYSGVMGLPLYETAQLLEEFGLPIFGNT
jgi:nucleoside triphosphate pyrophosphatase